MFVAVNEAYQFPTSYVGDVIQFSCLYGQTDEAKTSKEPTVLTRACKLKKGNRVEWDQIGLTNCRRSTKTMELQNFDLVGHHKYKNPIDLSRNLLPNRFMTSIKILKWPFK